jgi:hypothetical protein
MGDGCTMLLSAGGDCTLQFWDTQAVGPYGKVFHHGSSSSTQKLQQKKGGTPPGSRGRLPHLQPSHYLHYHCYPNQTFPSDG